MTKIGNTLLRAALGVLLLFAGLAATAATAFAETVSLTVPADATEYTIEIYLNESKPFAGAEFGLTIAGGAGVTPLRYGKDSALSDAINVIPDAGGLRLESDLYLFGFVGVSNSRSGRVRAGTLTLGYEGNAPHTLTLSQMKLVYLVADGKVESEMRRDSEHFVIHVSRADASGENPSDPDNPDNPNNPDNPSNPNTPSASPGGGGTSVAGTAVTVDIGEDDTPLAAGDAGRSAYFDDVAAGYAWAYKEIDALYERGVVKGVAERLFHPASNVTRGDFTLMFVRAFGLTAEFTDNFSDVPREKYYYEAIGIARALGVAEGYSAAEFRPDAQISRQEMVTLVYRAMRVMGRPFEEGSEADTAAFADSGEVAEYALPAVRALVKAGVIKGSDGRINPKGFATRAETAVIVYRLMEGS
jgi:hypothetical protein